MKQPLRRVLGITTGVASFVWLIFVLNPIQMASLLVLPFSRRAFRGINRWCARSIWGMWVVQAEVQHRIDVRIVGDRPVPRENTLVLSNHQSMADVMLLLCIAWRCGRIGDMKVFVKDIIKFFPGFGWGMLFLDCIFVKRNWAQDQGEIERLFAKFKRDQIPIFLVSFLEGTRLTPAKAALAQAFAAERGLPVPQHTLIPRTKGFVATMAGLRDHLDAVYDLTIGYQGDAAPSLVDCYAGNVDRVDIHIQRIPIAEIPETEAEQIAWVHQRFEDKDRLLAQFRREGRFPGPPVDAPVEMFDWFLGDRRRCRHLQLDS